MRVVVDGHEATFGVGHPGEIVLDIFGKLPGRPNVFPAFAASSRRWLNGRVGALLAITGFRCCCRGLRRVGGRVVACASFADGFRFETVGFLRRVSSAHQAPFRRGDCTIRSSCSAVSAFLGGSSASDGVPAAEDMIAHEVFAVRTARVSAERAPSWAGVLRRAGLRGAWTFSAVGCGRRRSRH